jgi:hypothetical protein
VVRVAGGIVSQFDADAADSAPPARQPMKDISCSAVVCDRRADQGQALCDNTASGGAWPASSLVASALLANDREEV